MELNKENYEEYFLMYADNELTQQERQAVEMFVASHPEYTQEFQDILSTVQMPDDVSLSDKTFLMKNQMDAFIDSKNCEERFVRYHDGELKEGERLLVQEFLNKNKTFAGEFDLIRDARMEPDPDIHYPGIKELYKRSTRRIYITLSGYAAAAVLIGLIVWFGMHNFSGDTSNPTPPFASHIVAPPAPEAGTDNNEKQSVKSFPSENLTAANSADENNSLPSTEKNGQLHRALKMLVDDKGGAKENKLTDAPDVAQIQSNSAVLAEQTKEVPEIQIIDNLLPVGNIGRLAMKIAAPESDISGWSENKVAPQESIYAGDNTGETVFDDTPDGPMPKNKIGILVKKVQRTINRGNPVNRWLNGENGGE